ncbi:MAG: hypothetical protein LBD35_07680 [Prevotellaceae bacterium]|nr:hypothetical protein [Prevotellaceae bacterium]
MTTARFVSGRYSRGAANIDRIALNAWRLQKRKRRSKRTNYVEKHASLENNAGSRKI